MRPRTGFCTRTWNWPSNSVECPCNSGPDVASTILAFAKEYAIKIIVVGKSNRTWIQRLLGGSIVERLSRESSGIDIMVVDLGGS